MVSSAESPTDTTALNALVVDDEKEVADAYALRLRDLCDVQTAYSGQEALDSVEASTIDIVLLDRHMPSMSGDEVLAELDERGFDGRVIMVTAVDPGFDVLDLPFDDYLCKPIDREDLWAAIDHQRIVLAYEALGKYYGVESKRAVIESEIPVDERANRPEYAEIEERATQLEHRVRRLLDEPSEILDAFDDIEREER